VAEEGGRGVRKILRGRGERSTAVQTNGAREKKRLGDIWEINNEKGTPIRSTYSKIHHQAEFRRKKKSYGGKKGTRLGPTPLIFYAIVRNVGKNLANKPHEGGIARKDATRTDFNKQYIWNLGEKTGMRKRERGQMGAIGNKTAGGEREGLQRN